MLEFMTGVLFITILSSVLSLLLPEDMEMEFLPIIKIAMGIWIIHSITAFFGHSLF
ncbi:hypothetical protein SLU01_25270 [Sporosarcina luteola]|uniref:Uncharacterized protein n=1 Tax=Sporosarcina luteola TaxID=582850 RepID=A0A511Z9T9_9BACL|nr:hypothetical protein [Sporosarcina luteola]GEN84215.1 hypothetical protein SLU01_25270 [Sporosarcina luteola]